MSANPQYVFKRYELKYLIDTSQQKLIENVMQDFVMPDEYGKSSIRNIYFDTPDRLLIRRSIEKPVYKEKLRLRSYGTVSPQDKVFIELKKKHEDVVYKRRLGLSEDSAMKYLCKDIHPDTDSQIMREIDYVKSFYKDLEPSVFISYDRKAYFGIDDKNFRITFDNNILWRDTGLSLREEAYGNKLLNDDLVLFEIKTSTAIPLWLTALLTEQKIYKTSFSKYGSVYTNIINQQQERRNIYAR